MKSQETEKKKQAQEGMRFSKRGGETRKLTKRRSHRRENIWRQQEMSSLGYGVDVLIKLGCWSDSTVYL